MEYIPFSQDVMHFPPVRSSCLPEYHRQLSTFPGIRAPRSLRQCQEIYTRSIAIVECIDTELRHNVHCLMGEHTTCTINSLNEHHACSNA